jgi:hypothetical protein
MMSKRPSSPRTLALISASVVTLVCIVALSGSRPGPKLDASVLAAAGAPADASSVCPGSPAMMHAKCCGWFRLEDFSCKDVKEEVERRVAGKDGWKDPKTRPGTYELLESAPDSTLFTRTTGDGNAYVDKIRFVYADKGAQGCVVTGCSESQTTSAYDYSTNYCTMWSMLCGKKQGCKVCRHDFAPPVESLDRCLFHDQSQCFR